MEIISAKKENLSVILKSLKGGKVLICPTDTVYGLVCDATNKKAVEKIFKIKERPKEKAIPVFVRDIKMAKKLALINKKQEQILKKHWPGKFTFILQSKKLPEVGPRVISRLVVERDGTIGLRIPNYKLVNRLLEKFNKPIAQTSANISDQPPTTKIEEVLKQFRNEFFQPDLAIDAGNLKKSKPSKVINLIGGKFKTLRY